MRMLNTLALAGVLFAPLPLLAQDSDAPSGHECAATVRGLRGEAVSFSLLFDSKGNPAGSSASWRPPQEGDPGRGDLTRPDVTLWITFDTVTARSIGRPVDAQVSVSVFSPLRARQAPGKLAARLAGFSGNYRFGEAAFAPMTSFASDADTSLPGSAQVSQSIPMPQPLPQWLDVQILSKKGRLALSTRFALNGPASRDALFTQAWANAQSAAADPRSCAPNWD